MKSLIDAGRGKCYRCWQVGREDVLATCVVIYNEGTAGEWKSASCRECAQKDEHSFPDKVRVILCVVR